MTTFETLTFSLGLIGTVLGIINTYDLIQKNWVRIKIHASLSGRIPGDDQYSCSAKRFNKLSDRAKRDLLEEGRILLNIRNHSIFSIYITNIGFTQHRWLTMCNAETTTVSMPQAIRVSIATKEQTLHHSSPLGYFLHYPIMLAPRDSIDILCPSEIIDLALSNKYNADCVTTACGKTRMGSVKAIMDLFRSQE